MIPRIDIPTTLRPRRTRTAGLFLVCLLFVLGGAWMVHDGERIGYFVAGFFALGLAVFALQFHPRAAYLHLAPEGFTFCGLFRAHTVRWIEVNEFGVTRVGPNQMVAWDYRPNYEPHARGRALSTSV